MAVQLLFVSILCRVIRAFKVYVRPMFEYAVSVWSPCYNYAIDRVESVQRKFKKRLN